jgi:hypothetical protein
MLFENLLVTPTLRTIKFRYQGAVPFDADLIDPVFVTVKGQGSAIAHISLSFHGIHDKTGGQSLKGVLLIGHSILHGFGAI